MADQKETVILDFQVEQGSALNALEKTKSAIISLKKDQENLNKAYKAGQITQEEYAKELVRVEAVLKRNQSEYNNIQKSVTGVKTSIDKLVESNKQMSKGFQDATQNIKVAGISVGDVTTKLASFVNPATAAVGIVSALGAAYASSTIGAKDLAFASNQLSSAIGILSNNFAGMLSSAEDGKGAVSNITDTLIRSFGDLFLGGEAGQKIADTSKQLALIKEQLEDLQREEIQARVNVSDRLADNQELLTKIQDSQTSYNEKIHLTGEILENLNTNEDELLAIKNKQLTFVNTQLEKDKENEGLQTTVLNITREIANIQKDTERKRQGVLRQESNITDQYSKQADALKKQREETGKKIQAQQDADEIAFKNRQVSFNDDPTAKDFDPQTAFEKNAEVINAELGLVQTSEEAKQTAALQTNAVNEMIYKENRERLYKNLDDTKDQLNQLAGLFSQGSAARKAFALAGIAVDTGEAIAHLTEKSEDNPLNAPTFGAAGIIQFATGLIRILTNIAAAKQFLSGSFAGGGDFITSKPTLMLVGDNPGGRERVTVEPLSGKGKTRIFGGGRGIAMAGGGSLTTGFDDGGISKNNIVAGVHQQLAMANSIKNLPIPEISVKEFTRVANRVKVKEAISKQ